MKVTKNLIIGIAGLIFLALTLFLIMQWFKQDVTKPVAPVGIHIIATPAKQVAAIPKHQAVVKSGTVRVYESRAKIELKLPEAIKQDDAKQVLESTRVSSDDHDQTITTVLNTETGDTETLVRREPLPWLAWDTHGGIALGAGIKDGQPTTSLEGRQNIFAIKEAHFGFRGNFDQPINPTPDTKSSYYIRFVGEYTW